MTLPKNFLFLSSTGRSGTTITRRSLGLHHQIYYNGEENNLIQDVIEVAKTNCTLESRKKAMVIKPSEYKGAFRELITRLIWPDPSMQKLPTWMAAINPTGQILDFLSQLFPTARIVCLIRNPVGMISSRMRYGSFKNSSFESHCNVWIRSEGVYRWCQQHPSVGRIFRHEWLYSPGLDSKLNDLFDWLELDDDPAVAENINNRIVHPTGETAKFDQLTGPQRHEYFSAKQDRWRDWSAENKRTFTKICGKFAEELGYAVPF